MTPPSTPPVTATDLAEASDAALVVRVARYDEAALAEIYRRHAGPVHGLARRLLQDARLAEEVVQEVFTRLWHAPERYDPARGGLRPWLLAVTHGRSVDIVRSETARRAREERDERRAPAPVAEDVASVVEGWAVATHVKAAVRALPVGERRAIELAYFGGHTYREVAAMLREPEGTVKTRIRTGLRRLRQELAGTFGEEFA